MEDTAALAEKLSIPFTLISDPELEAIRSFGVLEAEHDMAVPAIFILNQDGQTVWREVGKAIQDRVRCNELLKVLKELRQSGKLPASGAKVPEAATPESGAKTPAPTPTSPQR